MRPSGPCTETMSGEVSASSYRARLGGEAEALGLVALGLAAGEQLAGAALLADRRGRSAPRARRRRTAATARRAGAGRRCPSPRGRRSTSARRTPRSRGASGTGPGAAPRASLLLSAHAAGAMSARSCFLQLRGRVLGRDRAQLRRPRRARARPGGRAAGARRCASRTAPRPAGRCAPTGSAAAGRRAGGAAARAPSCSSAAPSGPSSSKRAAGRRGTSISWNGTCEAHGASSTASSSIATIRARRRTSSCTRSPSRLEPIVRTA